MAYVTARRPILFQRQFVNFFSRNKSDSRLVSEAQEPAELLLEMCVTVRRKPRPSPAPCSEGQESVWGYPRPPSVDEVGNRVRVRLGDVTIADTSSALRVLETSHPPNVYIPLRDVLPGTLVPCDLSTACEWKGRAEYFDVVSKNNRIGRAAWYYPAPMRAYSRLAGYVSFYARLMTACYIGDELVTPQPGDFYGGWITSQIVGPFKGEPGTEFW